MKCDVFRKWNQLQGPYPLSSVKFVVYVCQRQACRAVCVSLLWTTKFVVVAFVDLSVDARRIVTIMEHARKQTKALLKDKISLLQIYYTIFNCKMAPGVVSSKLYVV